MRALLAACRKGHKLAGKNILWHTRYKGELKFMVRECRTCANARARVNRIAKKRNQELDALAKAC